MENIKKNNAYLLFETIYKNNQGNSKTVGKWKI